jgi:selenocysteine-specific elongation factor
LLEQPRLAPGERQMAQLRLERPLAVLPGERFVIRTSLKGEEQTGLMTVGGGRVLGASNQKLRRGRPWTLQSLRDRREALDEPARWFEVVIRQTARPMSLKQAAGAASLRLEEAQELLPLLKNQGCVLEAGESRLVHQRTVQEAAGRILEAVQDFHKAHPQREGVALEELRSALSLDGEVLALALRALEDQRQLQTRAGFLALAGWKAGLSAEEESLRDRLAGLYLQARWAPPETLELAAELRQPLNRVQALVQVLTELGVLVRIDPKLVVHQEAVQAAKEVALKLFAQRPSFTTMEFRDALGVSRKYAVPLLDYLDSVRFTARSGNVRTPGSEAKKLLPKPGA